MDEKRSAGRTKRQAKAVEDAGKWDCTVCTFKNPPQAFKCEICDVRKGTSTRKPRVNPEVVAQQVAQQFTPPPPPPPPKKEKLAAPKKERSSSTNSNESSSSRVSERERSESPEVEKLEVEKPELEKPEVEKPNPTSSKETSSSKEATSKTWTGKVRKRPKLKNIDRSSAQHIAVTVNNITVIITDFKPKKTQACNKQSTNNETDDLKTTVKQEKTGE